MIVPFLGNNLHLCGILVLLNRKILQSWIVDEDASNLLCLTKPKGCFALHRCQVWLLMCVADSTVQVSTSPRSLQCVEPLP
jgi:hypothetical protein